MIEIYPGCLVPLESFRVQGPAHISFSGGRTSGLMLWLIVQAHGGTLPPDVHVIFANTGKERNKTLDFVWQCGMEWGIEILWVEWREEVRPGWTGPKSFGRWVYVDHASASRQGEPFAALIQRRGYLPNVVTRYCTEELKIRPMTGVMIEKGYDQWTDVIGLRADEQHRIARKRFAEVDPEEQLMLEAEGGRRKAEGGRRKDKLRYTYAMPLDPAGITKADVMAFWAQMPFDLALRQHEGNCDLCFLKGAGKLLEIIRRRPGDAQWWIDQEKSRTSPFVKPGKRLSYAGLLWVAEHQLELSITDAMLEADDPSTECHCHD